MLHVNIYDVEILNRGDIISIQDDFKLLKTKLSVEPLTANSKNLELIQSFTANEKGKGLEYFLHNDAWTDDLNGNTKVYLVKEDSSDEILFYFALKAGLLYRSIKYDDFVLTEKEREIVEICVEYYLQSSENITTDEILSWYTDESFDNYKLAEIIEYKIDVKLQARNDLHITNESQNIERVLETFPGIVITHFCKNESALFKPQLAFPLGFYVFWEIIVNIVTKVSKFIGIQYLYLFAAYNTDNFSTTKMNLFNDDGKKPASVLKLVDYYKREFKFETVQGMTILKPYYDFECYTLLQSISDLRRNRKRAWEEQLFAESCNR